MYAKLERVVLKWTKVKNVKYRTKCNLLGIDALSYNHFHYRHNYIHDIVVYY